jgi:hypothetical protein
MIVILVDTSRNDQDSAHNDEVQKWLARETTKQAQGLTHQKICRSARVSQRHPGDSSPTTALLAHTYQQSRVACYWDKLPESSPVADHPSVYQSAVYIIQIGFFEQNGDHTVIGRRFCVDPA